MAYNEYLEELNCRDHVAGLALDLNGFTLPGDKAQYARDRVVDIKHVNLERHARPRRQARQRQRQPHLLAAGR